MKNAGQNESGNALWLILIAVALLAVLTVTVSRSTDTTEQSGNIERYRIQASDIMRHTSGIREATGRMSLNNVGESQISFENDFTSASYVNAKCGGSDCIVFGSAGGGVSYRVPVTEWLDAGHSGDTAYGEWIFSGENAVAGVRTGNPELLMMLGYLKQNLCAQINAMLDISGIPVDADGIDTAPWQGTFAATETIAASGGAEAGCVQDTSANGLDYTFYQVLVKR